MRVYNLLATRPDEPERKEAEVRVDLMADREMRAGTLFRKGLKYSATAHSPWLGGGDPQEPEMCRHGYLSGAQVNLHSHPQQGAGKSYPWGRVCALEYIGHALPQRMRSRQADACLRNLAEGG